MTRDQLLGICIRKTKDDDPEAQDGFKDDLVTAEGIVAALIYGNERIRTKTLSLQQGVETYDLDSTVGIIEQMRLTIPANKEKIIDQIRKKEFRRFNPNTSNESETIPNWWRWHEPTQNSDNSEQKRVSFYPIPDTDYTIEYSFNSIPIGLTTAAQVPYFDSKYHHILADYAIWQYAESEADETMNPNYWENKWDKGLSLIVEYGQDQEMDPPAIKGPDMLESDGVDNFSGGDVESN